MLPTPAERAAREAELAALGYKEEFTEGIDRTPDFLVRGPTAEEAREVAEMQRLLDADGVVIPQRYWEANHFEARVSLFNRYVVANDGHVRHAKDMLVADIHWRDEIRMLELQRVSREAVTGVPDALFTRVGSDKDDRIVDDALISGAARAAASIESRLTAPSHNSNTRPHSTTGPSSWATSLQRRAATTHPCVTAA